MGVTAFSSRDKIIQGFRAYDSKRSKSKSRSKSRSSKSRSRSRSRSRGGSSSSSGSDDEIIKDALSEIQMTRYYKPLVDAGFDTLAKCETLTHADLRSIGVSLFGQRDKLLQALKKAGGGGGGRSSSSGTRGRASSSTRTVHRAMFRAGDFVKFAGRAVDVDRGDVGTVMKVLAGGKYLVRWGAGRSSFETHAAEADLRKSYDGPKKKGGFFKKLGF